MKLVHAADLHLDSPLRGLDKYEGAPVDMLRLALRGAFENLVRFCVDEDARLLLLAGDIYDGAWKDYGTGLFFHKQMAVLREAGVRVVLLRGNHDAVSQITKKLRLPDNVRELGHTKPETVVFEDLGVAVHGQSFATRAMTEDLTPRYPEPLPGMVNVGMLHTSVDGREGHDTYAPTTVQALRDKGYDYWALGHVHAREVLSTKPWIVFAGNLQGRHAKETGPKGATVVTLAGGRVAEVSQVALDVVRWAALEVDASTCDSAADVVDRVREELARAVESADGRPLAARVTVVGASPAHLEIEQDEARFVAEVRAAASDVRGEVWIEKVRLRTRAKLDLAALRSQDDAVGALCRALDALRTDDAALLDVAASLDELKKRLPEELRAGEEPLRLDDVTYLRGLVGELEQGIVPRLVRAERGAHE